MNEFFPEIEPYQSGFLQVSEIHKIYYEQVGNPAGIPIVFLHGGPGGGIQADHRRYFHPEKYRIILFDQRGCGNSTPAASLEHNTTWDLVNDIEKLREFLQIPKWAVFGGSWGSTLALSYAIKHTDKITGLILRGIFLCRPSEIKWFYQEGASQLFPDLFEAYQNHIPENERHDFVQAYHKRLTSDDYLIKLNAAKIWSKWEAGTSRLIVNPAAVDNFEDPELALAFARIECHYFINKAFFPTDNWILENCHVLKDIPTWIVQGRYDVVCPPQSAWDLHKALPQSHFKIIPDAGHAASEPGIRSALIDATNKLLLKLR